MFGGSNIGRRKFISGFTGSAGMALIGEDKAYLWTDGRYFLQAEAELSGRPEGEAWQLMRSGQPGVLEPGPFLAKIHADARLETPVKVGVDPSLLQLPRWRCVRRSRAQGLYSHRFAARTWSTECGHWTLHTPALTATPPSSLVYHTQRSMPE